MNNPYPKNKFTMPVTWLRMTEYTHDWLASCYGGKLSLYGKPILSIAHMPGVHRVLQMEVFEDMQDVAPAQAVHTEPKDVLSMSAMRMDCLQNGCKVNPEAVGRICGLTREQLGAFVPVECPRMALTAFGVLRPWSRTTAFGRVQSNELIRLLRGAFWQAVSDYEARLREDGELPDTAIELIEGFCKENGIGELYMEDLRREWQRKVARRQK